MKSELTRLSDKEYTPCDHDKTHQLIISGPAQDSGTSIANTLELL